MSNITLPHILFGTTLYIHHVPDAAIKAIAIKASGEKLGEGEF